MFRFLETIRFEHGSYHLMDLHQARLNQTFKKFFPESTPLNLMEVLPEIKESGKYKIRVEYDSESHEITFSRYTPKEIKSIGLINSNLDYSFKYSDRSHIHHLVEQSGADEIIIVKEGLITDSSYANLAFFDGSDWWTPRQPLLAGTRRSRLLNESKMLTADITPLDIHSFEKISLINAMLDLGELTLPLSRVN